MWRYADITLDTAAFNALHRLAVLVTDAPAGHILCTNKLKAVIYPSYFI